MNGTTKVWKVVTCMGPESVPSLSPCQEHCFILGVGQVQSPGEPVSPVSPRYIMFQKVKDTGI